MEVPCVVNGFKVLPVKFNESSSGQHWLYYKEHSVREKSEDKPPKQTLFVLNVPPYCNEACFQNVFADCGRIKAVHFHEKPTAAAAPKEESQVFPVHTPLLGFKVAYVVFSDHQGLEKALKLNSVEPRILSGNDDSVLVGMEKWVAEYNKSIPDEDALEKEIEEYMKKFDEKTEEEVKQEKAKAGQPDEEGWITVTRRGRKPGLARTEAMENRMKARQKKKLSKKQLLNFYTFQIRESKMKHLAELRQKFEEDKKRIALMKQSRKFKPF